MEFETLMKECPLIAILRGITPEEMEQAVSYTHLTLPTTVLV